MGCSSHNRRGSRCAGESNQVWVKGVAAVAIGALAVVPATRPAEVPAPPTEAHAVRLAAETAPPIGAIPLAFIENQFQYCSVICPYVVQGAVTVPIATVLTPVTFFGSLQTTGSLLQSIGAAAASVTGAANAAATPIIENDVYRVVPKAFNNLEVAVVELFNVGSAVFQPGEFLQAVNTARERILAALNQPLPPPAPTETGAETLPQVVAVEAIRVFAAVAFQAGELLLLGIVQTPDAVAQELAQSGDPVAALAAGAAQATESIATRRHRHGCGRHRDHEHQRRARRSVLLGDDDVAAAGPTMCLRRVPFSAPHTSPRSPRRTPPTRRRNATSLARPTPDQRTSRRTSRAVTGQAAHSVTTRMTRRQTLGSRINARFLPNRVRQPDIRRHRARHGADRCGRRCAAPSFGEPAR
jgi:hypothetical protein